MIVNIVIGIIVALLLVISAAITILIIGTSKWEDEEDDYFDE